MEAIDKRRRCALGVQFVGGALLLWGVLAFTGTAVGGRPRQLEFAQRRTYVQVKRAAHGALPLLLLRSGGGLALLVLGARLRRSADQRAAASDPSAGAKK